MANAMRATPARLYDCVDKVIRESDTIRTELAIENPSYLTVTHVWGAIEDRRLPGIPWDCPIQDGKFEIVLSYCSRNNIRWLWMDCICVKQHNNADDAHDKEAEVGKMNSYYRNASKTLCIPENHEQFCNALLKLKGLEDLVTRTSFSNAENALIWDSIEAVDTFINNSWFKRTWTYQELLLSNDIELPNGTSLDIDLIRQIVNWYYDILHRGILQKPRYGASYTYIDSGAEAPIQKGWWVPVKSWEKIQQFETDGYLDLMTAISATRLKSCKYPVDRLYSLYGLIHDSEKVRVDYRKDLSEQEQERSGILVARWSETVTSVVQSGRMWPLLMDAVDTAVTKKGEAWQPKITAPELGYGNDHPEVLDSRNALPVGVTSKGLRMSVREIGKIVATSVSIGDGGGEWNKIVVCAWSFGAMGFDISPIKRQMQVNVMGSGAVEEGDNYRQFNLAVERALHAESLERCFAILEDGDVRDKGFKLFRLMTGWNKTIVCIRVEDKKPFVIQAWIHSSNQPVRGRCHVVDVTSEGIAARWVIVNEEDDGTYTKIGTVPAHPIDITHEQFRRVLFN